jgi:hypothetical protein
LVHRVELNPETGRAVLFNITTSDPRLEGNIDLEVAGSIEISAKVRFELLIFLKLSRKTRRP